MISLRIVLAQENIPWKIFGIIMDFHVIQKEDSNNEHQPLLYHAFSPYCESFVD